MKIISVLLFILLSISVLGQNKFYNPQNYFTIGCYNLENLFDTINDPNNPGDDEFLPQSKKKWNSTRYLKKVDDIANVIASINSQELPEIFGFCEIENKTVIKDIISNKRIKNANYQIVHEDSKEPRGIDVALIYRPDEFQYLSHNTFPIIIPGDTLFYSRDILYVKGIASKTDTFHIFVNHWSSRRGGTEKSEYRRVAAATVLRNIVDSVFKQNIEAKIIIVGDLNDEPTDKSIQETLRATNNQRPKDKGELYNLMYDRHLNKYGTYSYNGNWNMIDNLIISQNLLYNKQGYMLSTDGGQIYKEKWIMFDNPKIDDFTPAKTYGGNNYYGGISDHLPVFFMLKR